MASTHPISKEPVAGSVAGPPKTPTPSRSIASVLVLAVALMPVAQTRVLAQTQQPASGPAGQVESSRPSPEPPTRAPRIDNDDLFEKSLQAAAQTLRQYGEYDNPAELERFNRLGYRLAARSDFRNYPFIFTLVDMPIPNAFALPSGQIFVTRGMLDLGLDDDELAALLGHEIAHVTQEHFLRMRKRAGLLNALSTLVMAGAVYAASQSNDDTYVGPYGRTQDNNTARLAQGAMQASILATELLMRGYSRGHEDESDEEGQRLAAAAGFDPDGARRLMAKMSSRIPQTRAYGYLHTHPFLDDRARAAEARKASFKVQEPPPPPDEYRMESQNRLLEFLEKRKLDPPVVELLETSALNAWPSGQAAERIRLKRLEEMEATEMERLTLSRNYGKLIEAYQRQIEEVEALTPDSPLIARLRNRIGDFRKEVEALYPDALSTLEGGVYETPFLENFKSNFPQSTESGRVALELGKAYSRLGRETEAVENLLAAWEVAEGDIAEQAQAGLRNLAPILDQLGALEVLATQRRDEPLREMAIHRLDEYASKYKQIHNGADYLERFPSGLYADTIRTRLDDLADGLYREMVLYQRSGSPAKAVEKAKEIMENAPLSPAAERLSEDALADQA